MTTLVRRLRKCSCNNGFTREHGGNPISEGYQCGLCITRREAADRIEQLESEIARLRKAIEDGPHGELCSSRDWVMIFGHKCDCWKRAALEGK